MTAPHVTALPCLSVVLPVRNGGTAFVPALRSVLAQTFEDFELLVVDDGSVDGSAEAAATLGDARIRVLRGGDRPGLAARLNEGIDAARGAYIARMDADDLCFPDRFAQQLGFLRAHPEVDLVGTGALTHDGRGHITGLFPVARTHEQICRAPWRGFHLCHPTWMGRTQWFRRWRYRETGTRRCEDQELLLRSYGDSRFACLPEVLLAYRWEGLRLGKAAPARLAMLRWQLVSFVRQRRWGWLAASVAAAGAKLALDLATAASGARGLFDWRFTAGCEPELERQWARLLASTEARTEPGGGMQR